MDPVWVILVALPLLFLWIVGTVDVLRRRDMPAPAKTLWILVMLVVPVLGLIVYFFARPHDASVVLEDEAAGQGGSRSVASELEALAARRESGAISEDDFQAEKYRVLGLDRS
jgi:hypothetical protein